MTSPIYFASQNTGLIFAPFWDIMDKLNICARSSVDRVFDSDSKDRGFESRRARSRARVLLRGFF